MTSPEEKFALTTSRGFSGWLHQMGGSLAFTTYQAGKVLFIGLNPDGRLSIFERSFPRCMGLAVSENGRTILMATHYQLYRFDNILPTGQRQGQYDAVYAPHQTWITGDIDIHDVEIDKKGEPVFINTLFNCVATVGNGASFKPLWQPPFISKLAAEDRCHLNGLATEDGAPKYVTCVSRSDASDGWRDRRADGGLVIDVTNDNIVAEGLSMPHSPRLYEGKLWLLNSGTGYFGWLDPKNGKFNPVTFCPGYARGLTLVNNYAVIGLSQSRDNKTFQGLPLNDALKDKDVDARCGLLIVDLNTGDAVEWVRIEGVVQELFDVAFLPNVRTPSAIGLKGQEILKVISIDESG